MVGTLQMQETNDNKVGGTTTKQEKKKKFCSNCKSWVYHNSDKCYTLEKNKQNFPLWYNTHFNPVGQEKGETKHDEGWGLTNTVDTVISVTL